MPYSIHQMTVHGPRQFGTLIPSSTMLRRAGKGCTRQNKANEANANVHYVSRMYRTTKQKEDLASDVPLLELLKAGSRDKMSAW